MKRVIGEALARIDRPVIFLAAALVLFGILTIASATNDGEGDLPMRQVRALGVGLLIGLPALLVPYPKLLKVAPFAYAALVVALGLVLEIGPNRFGAQRWLVLGGFQIQPSEPLKLVLILVLARVLRFGREIARVRDWLPLLLLVLVPFGLIVKQPDLGTSLIYLPVGMSILFAAGIPARTLAILLLGGVLVGAFAFFFLLHPYQKERIRSTIFLDRLAPYEANREGFQLRQSLLAVRSGGVLGRGWGAGPVTQSGKLPEAHNDFIFAVICEEFGFLGATAVLLVFLLLILAIVRVGLRTRDPPGRVICIGTAALVAAQAGVQAGVSIGVVPTTGMPLPFVSYGGSAMVTFVVATCLVLNVSCHPLGGLAGARFERE